jgi:anti-anti-sigma regulatory factor
VLRITVEDGETATTMRLEGKLAGPEVKALAECWLTVVTTNPHKSIVVDLKEVTSIDAAGKKLLAEMHNRGVQLVAVSCLTRTIVEEIERKTRESDAQLVG